MNYQDPYRLEGLNHLAKMSTKPVSNNCILWANCGQLAVSHYLNS